MARRRVRSVVRAGDGSIRALCNPGERWSPRAVSDVIADIESGRHSYYVEEKRVPAEVTVVSGASGKYLRSEADGTEGNELGSLPSYRRPAPARAPWLLGVPPAGAVVFLAVVVAVVAAIITWSAADGFCVVCLELAGTTEKAASLLTSLSAAELQALKDSILLDFIFMASYAVALWLGCRWGSSRFLSPGLRSAGVALGWGAVAAAVLDAVENAAIAGMLWQGWVNGWTTAVSIAAAVPKFVLAGLAVVYLVSAFVVLLTGAPARSRAPGGPGGPGDPGEDRMRRALERVGAQRLMEVPPGASTRPVGSALADPLVVETPEAVQERLTSALQASTDQRLQFWASEVLADAEEPPAVPRDDASEAELPVAEVPAAELPIEISPMSVFTGSLPDDAHSDIPKEPRDEGLSVEQLVAAKQQQSMGVEQVRAYLEDQMKRDVQDET